MKKSLFALVVCSALPLLAQAEGRMNSLGATLDGMEDTEHPAGDRAEKHRPRFGLEYTRTVWPRLDVFAGAGVHRLQLRDAEVRTNLNFFDLRLGARQYFTAREIQSWAPFIDASISEGWLRDGESTVGGNRRYGGWNASLGVSKLLSDNTDLRLALGYTRLLAAQKRNDHTDVLSSADLRLAVAIRY